MKNILTLDYKDEIESIKENREFEKLGDERYLFHPDYEARLYWAYCRPSGSLAIQIEDPSPLVSVMAFNNSRLPLWERFKLLHLDAIDYPYFRAKILNKIRMLFLNTISYDLSELNKVLHIAPIFSDIAVEQIKNTYFESDKPFDEIEATKLIKKVGTLADEEFFEALFERLQQFEDLDVNSLKLFLENLNLKKDSIDERVLIFYQQQVNNWIESSNLHILQIKLLQKLSNSLVPH